MRRPDSVEPITAYASREVVGAQVARSVLGISLDTQSCKVSARHNADVPDGGVTSGQHCLISEHRISCISSRLNDRVVTEQKKTIVYFARNGTLCRPIIYNSAGKTFVRHGCFCQHWNN